MSSEPALKKQRQRYDEHKNALRNDHIYGALLASFLPPRDVNALAQVRQGRSDLDYERYQPGMKQIRAVLRKDEDMLKRAVAETSYRHPAVPVLLARAGTLNGLKWAVRQGFPKTNESVPLWAAKHDNLPMFKYATKHFPVTSDEVLEVIEKNGNKEMLAFADKHYHNDYLRMPPLNREGRLGRWKHYSAYSFTMGEVD